METTRSKQNDPQANTVSAAQSPSAEAVREMLRRWFPAMSDSGPLTIHTDTSDFFGVEYGDVVLLSGTPYLIRQNAKEGRFGLDDEEKFWVKRAVDLLSGTRKIIKLVFHEQFTAHIGDLSFECFRSPKKEARILALVRNHPNFMQGFSVQDERSNVVRILDVIAGRPLSTEVEEIREDHESYFHGQFPAILDRFLEAIRAIRFLHEHGEKHGDIRRDHLFVDRDGDSYRWIDFDFNFRHRENMFAYDLFGLGNILMFLVGKGDVLLPELIRENHPSLTQISEADENIVFHHRVANLKKIYPYIPEPLNRVLLHFSRGANWFYENTGQMLEDLAGVREKL